MPKKLQSIRGFCPHCGVATALLEGEKEFNCERCGELFTRQTIVQQRPSREKVLRKKRVVKLLWAAGLSIVITLAVWALGGPIAGLVTGGVCVVLLAYGASHL
ncbi:hypothetical protein KKB83_04540 [Patescibacteria group bacterium]|nr:hypothetical protein [Patescibacteria group bacterium]